MNELKDILVISGPVGSIYFELLQLILILHVIIFYFKKNKIEGIIFSYGFIIHIIRLYLNYEISLEKTNQNKILSLISLIFLIYSIINNFNYFGFEILFGLLYAFLAIYNFLVLKQDNNIDSKVWHNRKIYYFIPLTIFFIYLSYLNIDNNILPLILGDSIYHFVDLIYYFYNKN